MKQLKRILYVEDEPDIREIAKFSLEEIGSYQVLLCASGKEALQQIAEFRPDIILLDVMMPDMDGPATLAAIHDLPLAKEIPVLFMTAKVQPEEIAELKALGAIQVIPKPFDPMTLAKQIQSIWESL